MIKTTMRYGDVVSYGDILTKMYIVWLGNAIAMYQAYRDIYEKQYNLFALSDMGRYSDVLVSIGVGDKHLFNSYRRRHYY